MNSKELKKEFTDEKTGISYTLVGDYYVPNIEDMKNSDPLYWVGTMNMHQLKHNPKK